MREPAGRALIAGSRPPSRVLAFGAYRFPHGDAMSNRLLQLARSATPRGGTTVVINDWPGDGTQPPVAPRLPSGVRLITLPGGGGRSGVTRWLRRSTRPVRALIALRRAGIGTDELVSAQLPLGLWNLATWAVLRLFLPCPLTVDVSERHDPAQFPSGRWAPYFIRHRWSGFLAGRLADRIIAVSVALGRDFVERGRPTLVVPPQVDCDEYAEPAPPPIRAGLRLFYAGSPGAKDLLAPVIDGIRSLPAVDRSRVHLVIAGITAEQANGQSDLTGAIPPELSGRVTFLGRVAREEVLAELARAHFSVLVRPVAGYAEAGFPSKIPESLAAGCPVLVNHTSDLARYITDGREGIVLTGPGTDDVRSGLTRALMLDDDRWREMSRAARQQARSFDYKSWTSTVGAFVCAAGPAASQVMAEVNE